MTQPTATPGAALALLEAVAEAVAEAVVRRMAAAAPQATGSSTRGMTYAEASKVSGLGVSLLRRAAARGDLAVVRCGPRSVLILPADLERFVQRRRVGAEDEPVRLRAAAGGGR